MSPASEATRLLKQNAPLFAALGDQTRVSLLIQLGEDGHCSITQLAEGRPQTRQAIRKHLRVLEDTKLVRGSRHGREHQFEIIPSRIKEAAHSLELISRQWDDALERLKTFVERQPAKGSADHDSR